jgi:hypothetical protein
MVAFVAGCGGGSESTAPSKHAARVETAPATVGAGMGSPATKAPRPVRSGNARVVAAVPPGAPPKRVPVRVPKAGDKSIQTFGEAASEAEYVAVANTVRAFALARASGDVDSASALLASRMKDQLVRFFAMAAARSKTTAAKHPTCARALGQTFEAPVPDYAKRLRGLPVTDARIKGDRGCAIFRMPGIKAGSFPVQREKGGWRVALLAGAPVN